MTDRQSTKNYARPHPVPASDTLVLGAAKATSYGPRVKPYNDGIVEPAKSDMDADFWSVYEWWPSRHAPKGGWWEWRADCDTEDIARTLAEAIAGVAQQPAARTKIYTNAVSVSGDEALLRQALEALSRARQTAMEQTLKARIPECAEFAGIAQDLDFVVAALRARLGDEKENSND